MYVGYKDTKYMMKLNTQQMHDIIKKYTSVFIGRVCGAVDKEFVSQSEGCEFEPHCDQYVLSGSKTLYCYYFTLPMCKWIAVWNNPHGITVRIVR